ncbi:transposase [Paracoccus aestuariivivens]|uniref:Transposase n=1 Tax=Paracoccus aestuariivivens TaxID=1820333 RepID=A0A6L6JBG9_9RHOB|nr:transposase [Paracoccus aestuariivivens]
MMSKGARRRFTAEFKERSVARLSKPDVTQAGVAQELGITSSQLKGWRLELEAAGSAEVVRRRKAEAELAELVSRLARCRPETGGAPSRRGRVCHEDPRNLRRQPATLWCPAQSCRVTR